MIFCLCVSQFFLYYWTHNSRSLGNTKREGVGCISLSHPFFLGLRSPLMNNNWNISQPTEWCQKNFSPIRKGQQPLPTHPNIYGPATVNRGSAMSHLIVNELKSMWHYDYIHIINLYSWIFVWNGYSEYFAENYLMARLLTSTNGWKKNSSWF